MWRRPCGSCAVLGLEPVVETGLWSVPMYAVVRRYSDATRLSDALVQHLDEIRAILTSVPGFKAYHALRTADGGLVTMTVCEDQSGTQESSRRAAEWVRNNLAGLALAPPEITEGETFLSF